MWAPNGHCVQGSRFELHFRHQHKETKWFVEKPTILAQATPPGPTAVMQCFLFAVKSVVRARLFFVNDDEF